MMEKPGEWRVWYTTWLVNLYVLAASTIRTNYKKVYKGLLGLHRHFEGTLAPLRGSFGGVSKPPTSPETSLLTLESPYSIIISYYLFIITRRPYIELLSCRVWSQSEPS